MDVALNYKARSGQVTTCIGAMCKFSFMTKARTNLTGRPCIQDENHEDIVAATAENNLEF